MIAAMKRREFITLVGGAAGWPLGARAQQSGGMRRIGVLMGAVESDPVRQSELAAFRGALAKLGRREGSNLGVEVRWGGDPEFCARYAAELGRFVLRPRRRLQQQREISARRNRRRA
jgi:putative ABC transport system substrate-binding protein